MINYYNQLIISHLVKFTGMVYRKSWPVHVEYVVLYTFPDVADHFIFCKQKNN